MNKKKSLIIILGLIVLLSIISISFIYASYDSSQSNKNDLTQNKESFYNKFLTSIKNLFGFIFERDAKEKNNNEKVLEEDLENFLLEGGKGFNSTFEILDDGYIFDCATSNNPAGEPIQEIIIPAIGNSYPAGISIEASNVIVKNCNIFGSGQSQYGSAAYGGQTGISLYGVGNVTLINNEIHDANHGIVCFGSGSYPNYIPTNLSKIINNTLYHLNHGITFGRDTLNNLIENNEITDGKGDGISVYGAYNNISYNVLMNITSPRGSGILLGGHSKWSILSHNNISRCDIGIDFDSSGPPYPSNNTISHNNIYDNKGYGISIDYSNNNALSGNNLWNNSEGGIYLWHSNSILILNNTISRHFAYISSCGIKFSSQSNYNITIIGNEITQNMNGIKMLDSAHDINITSNIVCNNFEWDFDCSSNSNVTGVNNYFEEDKINQYCNNNWPVYGINYLNCSEIMGGQSNYYFPPENFFGEHEPRADLLCGDSINQSTLLLNDIVCPENYDGSTLYFSDDTISLDCNGHNIICKESPNFGYGLYINEINTFEIKNCNFINCYQAILSWSGGVSPADPPFFNILNNTFESDVLIGWDILSINNERIYWNFPLLPISRIENNKFSYIAYPNASRGIVLWWHHSYGGGQGALTESLPLFFEDNNVCPKGMGELSCLGHNLLENNESSNFLNQDINLFNNNCNFEYNESYCYCNETWDEELQSCVLAECSDGTLHGTCSLAQPLYCENGELIGCQLGCENNSCIPHTGSCWDFPVNATRCIYYDEFHGGPNYWLQFCNGINHAWTNQEECSQGCDFENGICITNQTNNREKIFGINNKISNITNKTPEKSSIIKPSEQPIQEKIIEKAELTSQKFNLLNWFKELFGF